MWFLLLLAAVVGASPQNTKIAYSGVKGGYSGNRNQYNAGENLVRYFGNNSQQEHGQQGYGGRPSYPGYEEPGVGVCFIEVPTANLVRNPSQVPAGNGSRTDLSRVRSCCKGYVRNIHNFRLCDPVCTEECVNALCSAPETCTCFPDHVKNAAGFCIPTCPIGCQNGQCAGGECICKNGYKLDLDGKYCVPQCPGNCGGISLGNCTSPNVCTCKPGYESTSEGSCKPTCTACSNGDCVAPNDCRCKAGYMKDVSGVCKPVCAHDCGPNGVCIGPNVCNNPTTTTTPSPYSPHSYNPSIITHNPNQNPQYLNQHSYNPSNPSERPLNSNYPYGQSNYPNGQSNYPNGQSNYPNGQSNYPNGQSNYANRQPSYPNGQPNYYPDQNRPSSDNLRPTSDSQIKPNEPNPVSLNQTLNYPTPSYPLNQNNPGSYQPYPYIPSNQLGQYPGNQPGQYPNNQPGQNPSTQPGQYPTNQPQYSSHQPGQYPNQGSSDHSSPNQPYPTYQYPNNPYPYDQTGNEDQTSHCSQPCINGICVEGNRCLCNRGYELDQTDSSGTRCQPRCAGGCQNGVCSAPNFCICDMGYRKEQGVKGGMARCVRRMKRSLITNLLL